MRYALKLVTLLLLVFILLISPKIGGLIADLFNVQSIDPDGAFMWISIHHIVQALIIMILMVFFVRFSKVQFHLGFGNRALGMDYLKKFMIIFSVYTAIAFVITVVSGSFSPFAYPFNGRNIVGYLGFQLLLSGPSEELIFRAFSITLFAFLITDKRINKHISYAVLFSSFIFGIAHIDFSFNPFSVSYSIFQVGYAMVLGYFYGDCYEKSKSVVYPMIMHSFTNVLMIGLTVLLSFLL
jgi:membrane protease YdiL (CAAX protease family)